MSRSCLFIETSPSVWHYLVEDETGSSGWDWREQSTAYGPFSSRDEAFDHRCDNHTDVSGAEIRSYTDGATFDPVVLDRIQAAGSPATPSY